MLHCDMKGYRVSGMVYVVLKGVFTVRVRERLRQTDITNTGMGGTKG